MLEKEFLAYVLYITLVEIREKAYEEKNWRFFHLTDMLHNVPSGLLKEEQTREEYSSLIQKVKELKIYDWWEKRVNEFEERFPEFKNQLPTENQIKGS
jgi:hypothetical protein